MIVSEARLAANRANAARSTGPRTPEGKAASRRNGLKHGLSGQGVVTPEGDAEEVARRVEDLTADMRPKSPAGALLIARMATLSVRSERLAEHESAAIARDVRHAADAFDEERIERANQLFGALADDPRGNLRKLRKMPEGVERLIDGWHDLRADLALEPGPEWAAEQLEHAASLTGTKARHARGTRLGALSRALWGDFAALGEGEGEGLDEGSRREWARAQLLELIDGEVAALEAHYEALDFEAIELDRAGAGSRALFDGSRPACLARRYESEAHRGFFRALAEFRRVEAESEARAGSAPAAPAASPEASRPAAPVGSSRETAPPPDRNPSRAFPDPSRHEDSVVRGPDVQPARTARPGRSPG